MINTITFLVRTHWTSLHPTQVVEKNEKDLSEVELRYLDFLYEERVSPSQISRILTKMKGIEYGSFLPKTIYNMNTKSWKMFDLAKGITSKMTDAEKTLKQLEL